MHMPVKGVRTLLTVHKYAQQRLSSSKCTKHVVIIVNGQEISIARVSVRDGEGHVSGKMVGALYQAVELRKQGCLRSIQTKAPKFTFKLQFEVEPTH